MTKEKFEGSRQHGEYLPEGEEHLSESELRERQKRLNEKSAREQAEGEKKGEAERDAKRQKEQKEMSYLEGLELKASALAREIELLKISSDPYTRKKEIKRMEEQIGEIIELRGRHEGSKDKYDKKSWFGKLVSGKPVNYRANVEYLQSSEKELEQAQRELEALKNPAASKESERRLEKLREELSSVHMDLMAQRRKMGMVEK